MELEWIINNKGRDDEGNTFPAHYLIDRLSDQCLALITEPRCGNILYVSDIRVAGSDRSFITLEACKRYCECTAIESVLADRKSMEKEFDKQPESCKIEMMEMVE